MKKIINDISNWSVKRIELIFFKIILRDLLYLLLFCAITFYIYMLNHPSTVLTKLITILFVLILYFIVSSKIILDISLLEILNNNIDLDKYLEIFNKAYVILPNKNTQVLSRLLACATISFYKGNFQESLAYLNDMRKTNSKKEKKFYYLFNSTYYNILNLIHYKHYSEAQKELKKMNELFKTHKFKNHKKQRDILFLQAVFETICEKKNNTFFYTTEPQNHLTQIMYAYYGALNSQLKGDETRAKELFESIAGENPELFYVQEARKYLEGGN